MSKWIDYLGNKVSYTLTKPLEKDKEYIATINKTDNMPAIVFLDDSILIGETADNNLTFISPSSGYSTISFASQTEMDIEWVQLKKGNMTTDWTPAPEDMLGKEDFQVFKTSYEANDKLIKARLLAVDSDKEGSIAYRLNETESTASGNTTTISDIKTKPGEQITGYQTIKERSDLYERVIGKDEEGIKSNMARMVMTDSLFKTEVIKNVPSAIGGRNYVLKSDEYYYTSDYKVAEYDLSVIPKGTKIKISIWGALDSGVRTFGIYVNNSSGVTSGNSHKIELTKLDGVYGRGRSAGLSKWTAEATLSVDASKILIYGFDNNSTSLKRIEYVQIETGDYYTDWTSAPEDKASMSAITQLENSIDLKVSDSELLSRINVQAGSVLITSGTNKLNITPTTTYIEDATIKSAMIDTINVKKITGITADFTSLVTKGLTADVISATMIHGNDALFEKLFSNTMATKKLSAQEAWITNANIVSLDASKINVGTIDTARLNATQIVTNGLSANVVKSTHIESSTALVDKIFASDAYITRLTGKTAFISSIKAIEIDADKITAGIASKTGNRVTITSTGMKVSDSTFETEFINGGPSFFTKTSSGRTFMGEIGDMTNALNGSKALGIKGAYGVPVILGVQMNKTDTTYASKIVVDRLGIGILDDLNIDGDILFGNNGAEGLRNLVGVDKIFLQGESIITATALKDTSNKSIQDTSGWINLQTQWGTNFWYQNQKKARQYGNKFQFWCNIEPQSGFSVSSSSDARLKHNISDARESSLEKLEKIQFKNFTWNSNNKDDFGFIAQEVINIIPEIIEESEDGYYRYNSTRFNMIVAHATKELNDKVKFLENKIERLERIIDGN